MRYCKKCGKELKLDEEFCITCGTPAKQIPAITANEQQDKFGNKIYKCPNCGEILKAFEVSCPFCQYELRGIKGSSAVIELSKKIEELDKKKSNNSFFGVVKDKLTGTALSPIEQQKISLISNFPIPNTKEDILEFMILSSSHILNEKPKGDITKHDEMLYIELKKAWRNKFEQAYDKAKICIKNESDLAEIERCYNKTITEPKKKKQKIIGIVLSSILALILLIGIIIGGVIGGDVLKKNREEEERINQTYIWPTDGLSLFLPKPEIIYGKINYDSEKRFNMELYQFTYEDFDAYINNCKAYGFTVDAEKSNSNYKAYNDEGYYLYIFYYNNEVDIEIKAPIVIDYSAKEMIEMKMLFDEAKSLFSEMGFVNIELVEVPGNIFIADGEVKSISIDGNLEFTKGMIFRYDDEIVIEYYK